MKRLWIWMIPIIAAVCTIWIQAAIHDGNPGAATRGSIAPLTPRDPAGFKTMAPDDKGGPIESSPQPAAPPH